MKREKIVYLVLAITMLFSLSCKKFMTVEPNDMVRAENAVKTATDAITAIQGLYGLMQPLTDQIFLAGEVQGDLVVAARGADKYIREIAKNRVTASNPYTDYTKFYRLIIACNQALKSFADLAKIDPVYNKSMYSYNIAEVTYIRAWTYLQLIKIWGDVPYIQEGVVTADQVRQQVPVNSDQLIIRLAKECGDVLDEMEFLKIDALGADDKMNAMGQFNNISARFLLAELYVYANDWDKAWNTIKFFDEGLENNAPATRFSMFGGQYTKWMHLITRNNDKNIYFNSVAMAINYDGSRNQFNSLIKWTGNKNGAVYALKPSANAINNWKTAPMMLQVYQTTIARGYFIDETYNPLGSLDILNADGTPVIGGYGDYIRGEKGSYFVSGQDTLIFKYVGKSRGVEKNVLINDKYSDNDMFFNLYRDANKALLLAEIYNHRNLPYLALQTFNGITTQAYTMKGTRNRVGVAPLYIERPNDNDVMKQVDKLILQESAMEIAFEGRRWTDIIRMAKRYPDDIDFLGEIIAKKYPVNMQSAIKARLRNRSSWYFPVYNGNIKAD